MVWDGIGWFCNGGRLREHLGGGDSCGCRVQCVVQLVNGRVMEGESFLFKLG